jgi:hypothetical protein
MKIKELLKIQSAFENSSIPEDLLEEENYYWSKSKNDYIKILDLDLHHLMRIVINLIDSEKEQLENNNKDSFKKLEISLAIGRILNEVDKIQSNISEVSNDKT